ncbi:DNA/RNA non-specific endonuclease [Kushneria phosphatilytica]|uniref:DNA/RNA non-specific endonuclease n=1 Tax=Kushneria phosphatilytica TaxID=657387 RepID=A0A1S1NSR8_9GAMM|nr:DNA/RNA non-specific endonuclease [Kushneria phosphatilytica]OHV08645.1 endonuclease [Kushneria phosphatilytica]QEL12357.1 DNA/RNA non-specific endonuclease [Kushneria phosphatilytica]
MTDRDHRPVLRDLSALVPSPAQAPQRTATASAAESLADRQGYDSDFLPDFEVPLPTPVGQRADDVTPVEGSSDNRLDYTHFSIVMSRSRRLAIFTALNIDGKQLRRIERGDDHWRYDDRIPRECQLGEALYADNPLDRGHLVRRTAPNWGEQAEQANRDTFHFTNCSPQMAGFNQQTWLGLEDYLIDHARADDQRITVFTGPVLRDSDRCYRGVQIPEAFWKVVAFVDRDGKPSASGYMIEQAEDLDRLGFMFGQYRTYQRSVSRIASLVELDFGALAGFDGFSNEEHDTGTRIDAVINGPEDIRL